MKPRTSPEIEPGRGALGGPPRKPSRGPRITLTCECGERRYLHYGERWHCDQCGRTWDTSRIPAEDYAAIRRVKRRFVAIPIAMLLVIVATVVLFMIYGRIYAFIVLPFTLTLWSMYGRPIHRRRLRQALDRLPQWEISPE
jgi:hypothetical protein